MRTIKIDYSQVERVEGSSDYYSVHRDDQTGTLYSTSQPLAYPAFLNGVEGDFFAIDDYDQETDEPFTVISEAATGAKICVGDDIIDAQLSAVSLFKKGGTKPVQDTLTQLIAEGFISPRYRIRKEVSHA